MGVYSARDQKNMSERISATASITRRSYAGLADGRQRHAHAFLHLLLNLPPQLRLVCRVYVIPVTDTPFIITLSAGSARDTPFIITSSAGGSYDTAAIGQD